MKITDSSIVPDFGVQVIIKMGRFVSIRTVCLPGNIQFKRHELVARKILPPVIGSYKLVRVDEFLLEAQYSWRRVCK